MAVSSQKFHSLASRLPAVAYLFTVAAFLWVMSGYYLPGRGMTSMLLIGDRMFERAIPALHAEKPYVEPDSFGYDGQFYVQLAMQPNLRDPELAAAVDNLPYRARRMLLPWTAWGLGGGDPGRAMHVYSVLNILSWLALAGLLLRWFPACSWNNYLRWAGVLLSSGLFFSARASLLDGPSLLVIAIAFAALENGRPWLAGVVLGIAGLIRETNVLAAGMFASFERRSPASWLKLIGQGVLVVAPCLLWMAYLFHLFGPQGASGDGNFDLPFRGFLQKWQAALAELGRSGFGIPNDQSLLMLVSLTAQAAFLLLRPRWSDAWWRLGATYLVLMVVLGPAVWAGYPGAAGRTLLPMGLAFNVLVPKGRRWLVVLLLGNATIFTSLQSSYPGGDSFRFVGADALPTAVGQSADWNVHFSSDWFPANRSRWEYWRWSRRDDAQISITNPGSQAVVAKISFALKSRDLRVVSIKRGQDVLWRGTITPELQSVQFDAVRLDPGRQVWSFTTEDPKPPVATDGRGIVCFRNLRIELQRVAQP